VYQSAPATGDVSLSAEITGQTLTSSPYANAGVELRASTSSGSAAYYVMAVGTNGTTKQGFVAADFTSSNSGSPTNLALIPESSAAVPGSTGTAATCSTGTTATCYLAVERRNGPDGTQQLEGFWSSDGSHWQGIAGSGVTISSSSPLYNAGDIGVALQRQFQHRDIQLRLPAGLGHL
jgi:hypothetical protein